MTIVSHDYSGSQSCCTVHILGINSKDREWVTFQSKERLYMMEVLWEGSTDVILCEK